MILFKCYWHDTTDKEIKVDPYHGLVETNTKPKLRNIDDIFFFCQSIQASSYTPSLFKMEMMN